MWYNCLVKMDVYDMFKQGGNDLETEVKKALCSVINATSFSSFVDYCNTDELDDDTYDKISKLELDELESDSMFFSAVTVEESELCVNWGESDDDSTLIYEVPVSINASKILEIYSDEK